MAENTLSKLLYIDNYEDHERIYLNVNILRDLNNYLKTQLTSIELSSLNNYYLESYLIEKTFDQTKEKYAAEVHSRLCKENSISQKDPDFYSSLTNVKKDLDKYTRGQRKYINGDHAAKVKQLESCIIGLLELNKQGITLNEIVEMSKYLGLS